MAKGPIITEYAKMVISEICEDHPNWRAKDVQREANRKLQSKAPKLNAVQKIMQQRRKIAEGVDTNLDAPWSLGLSAIYRIPSEANPELIEVWKWCFVVGLTFTVREARWVARLREIVPYEYLYVFAVVYARREKACQLLGFPATLAPELDFQVAFHQSRRLGGTPKLEDIWLSMTAKELGTWDRTIPRLLYDHISDSDHWDKEYFANRLHPASQAVEMYLDLGPQKTKAISENADMIYAMWLRLFSQCPKWKRISEISKMDIAERLYEEVAAKDMEYEDLLEIYRRGEEPPGWRKGWSLALLDAVKSWIPSQELQDEVGLSNVDEMIPLATYETERANIKPLWKRECMHKEE